MGKEWVRWVRTRSERVCRGDSNQEARRTLCTRRRRTSTRPHENRRGGDSKEDDAQRGCDEPPAKTRARAVVVPRASVLRIVDGDARLADVTQPTLRVLLEAALQQVLDLRRRVRGQRSQVRVAIENGRHCIRRRETSERIAA